MVSMYVQDYKQNLQLRHFCVIFQTMKAKYMFMLIFDILSAKKELYSNVYFDAM